MRRALRILACFEPGTTELGVTDLARELGMHKSTVHRLLATMEGEGFLCQLESGRYALTWKVLQLSAALGAHRGLRTAVLQVLEPLAERTQETAHLAVLDGDRVLYVEKVESRQQLRMPSAVGRHVALHSTALGKTLAAGLDDAALRRVLYQHPLTRFTPATMTDPEQVLVEIVAVRESGYAVDDEEIETGLMCVAAPVLGPGGETCAAISIAGPSPRVKADLPAHAAAVRKACERLSADLGPDVLELRSLTPGDGA